jgi:SAM-dependent methyltransferase
MATSTELALTVANRLDRSVSRALPAALVRHPRRCPACGYAGRFSTAWALTGRRAEAYCPACHAAERHRLQALVVDQLAGRRDFASMSMLHVAPEPILQGRFRDAFGSYTTADLVRDDVDLNVDLTDMPLETGSYDVVYASHVLEHIPDDRAAIAEIRRVLAPGGFAVLPVPIVCEATVEYPRPVASEAGHVRAPGPDYFERFTEFETVEVFRSADFGEEPQVYVVEDRTRYPNRHAPFRTPSPGRRHEDMVPVCWKERANQDT